MNKRPERRLTAQRLSSSSMVARRQKRTTPSNKRSAARRPHPINTNVSPASESSAPTSRFGTSSESVPITNATTKDVLALPSVHHFARENGVDIPLLAPGSGKHGRVERADVERYLAGRKSLVVP